MGAVIPLSLAAATGAVMTWKYKAATLHASLSPRPRRYRLSHSRTPQNDSMSSHPATQIAGQFTRFARLALSGMSPGIPAVVIAVLNLKGGCGKSTIAINLACELAVNGDSVLLLDNDSQGTSSLWLSHGRLPVDGKFMPLENDEDGERLMRTVAGRKERYVVLDAPAHVGAAALAAGRDRRPGAGSRDSQRRGSGGDAKRVVDLILTIARAAGAATLRNASSCRRKIDRRTDAGRRTDEHVSTFGENVGLAIHQRTAFVESFGAGTVDWGLRAAESRPFRHYVARDRRKEDPPDMKGAISPDLTVTVSPAARNGTHRAVNAKTSSTGGLGDPLRVPVERGAGPCAAADRGNVRRLSRCRADRQLMWPLHVASWFPSGQRGRFRFRSGMASPSSVITGYRRRSDFLHCDHRAAMNRLRRDRTFTGGDADQPGRPLRSSAERSRASGLESVGPFAGSGETNNSNEFIRDGIDDRRGIARDCREEGREPWRQPARRADAGHHSPKLLRSDGPSAI